MGKGKAPLLPINPTANQASRLDFAIRCILTKESFNNVIFSDESSTESDCHAKMVFGKPRLAETSEIYADSVRNLLKPKAKYSVKLHVWAGISKRGKTDICIFDGIMKADFYTTIIDRALVPFIRKHSRKEKQADFCKTMTLSKLVI